MLGGEAPTPRMSSNAADITIDSHDPRQPQADFPMEHHFGDRNAERGHRRGPRGITPFFQRKDHP